LSRSIVKTITCKFKLTKIKIDETVLFFFQKSSVLYDAEIPGIPTTVVLSNKTGGKIDYNIQ
jgi:hypothetical protein